MPQGLAAATHRDWQARGGPASRAALSIPELCARANASAPGPSRCPILPPICLSFLLKLTGTGTTVHWHSAGGPSAESAIMLCTWRMDITKGLAAHDSTDSLSILIHNHFLRCFGLDGSGPDGVVPGPVVLKLNWRGVASLFHAQLCCFVEGSFLLYPPALSSHCYELEDYK